MELEGWLALAQVVASFAAVVALVLAMLQWRAAAGQLRVMRQQLDREMEQAQDDRRYAAEQLASLSRAERTRNAFEIMRFIESPDMLQARGTLMSLKEKPFATWSPSERRIADQVLRGWQLLAFWDKSDVLPAGFVKEGYGTALIRHWRVLEPLVHDIRIRTGDPGQRKHLEDLVNEYLTQQ